jgi:hypothetical protein
MEMQPPRVFPSSHSPSPMASSTAITTPERAQGRLDEALYIAAALGHVNVVKNMLEEGRADPTAYGNRSLCWAAVGAYFRVVEALLADGRADPRADGSAALRIGAGLGYTGVVEALLADGRADPAARNSAALRAAASGGHAGIVRTLLADGRANPAVAAAEAAHAARYGFDPAGEVLRCVLRWQRWLRRRHWLRAAVAGGG